MTTNKPEVFEVCRTKQGALENVVLLADYEALQAEYEKLRKHLQNLIDQTTPLEPDPDHPGWSRRIELDEVMAERDQLRAECEKLRKDVSVLLICDECHDKCADPYTGLFASHCPDEEPCIMCECSSLRRQLAEQQPAPDCGWISVDERQPDKFGEYLAATTARPRGWVIRYAPVGWICSEDYPVTHWMPMPEPPQQGGQS